MLGRALNNYQPPPLQRDAAAASKVAAALKPTSSSQEPPKGIDDMMNEAPTKNKGSISGWANSGSINKPTPRPFARTTSSSGYQSLPGTYASNREPNELKRSSAAMDDREALAARIEANRQEALRKVRSWNATAPQPVSSFSNTRAPTAGGNSQNAINLEADIVDLTQDEAPRKSHVPTTSFVDLNWDPDDFENDSEIDINIEYALPLPKPACSAPPKPLQPITANKNSPSMTPPSATMQPPKTPKFTTQGLPIPSSAISWSSSPAMALDRPAPGRVQSTKESDQVAPMSSEASIDANPRPAKRGRRTLPWLQGESQCESCQSTDHKLTDCPKHPKNLRASAASQNPVEHIQSQAWTPLPSIPPYNTTAKEVKDKQNKEKTLQDMSRKDMSLKEYQKLRKGRINTAAKAEFIEAAEQDKVSSKKAEKSSNIVPGEIFLSDEQQKVLLLVTKEKKSVFFTGSAGTGKSVLMRAIIEDLRRTYKKNLEFIAVTASTGLAACNIGGVTLHSFSGAGLAKEAVPDLVKKILRNQKAKRRWLNCKVLIIDEISMVDGDFFDKLEGIARAVRKSSRPFGGIQLVVTGDFFQLPPVPDFGNRNVRFAFDADTWQTSIHHTIGLTEVFRQRDPVFANMLNEMRLGKLSDQSLKAFRNLDRPLPEDNVVPTELFPTRNEVDNANFMKLRALKGNGKVYIAEDGGTVKDKTVLERLLQNFMAPKMLELKRGAQVMLVKNMDEGLVNGSLGRVTRFATESQFSLFLDGKLEDIYDSDDEAAKTALSAKDKAQIRSMHAGGLGGPKLVAVTDKRYPVVCFRLPDGRDRELLVLPEDSKVELPNGEIQAQRRQLPLILAWALSIHKAQGQTLERVKVDLRRIFENGQAYVALSRATTQEGLWVQNFNAKAVMAHPRVAQFYDSLYSVNKALKHPKVCRKPRATGECPPELEMEGLMGRDGIDDDEESYMM